MLSLDLVADFGADPTGAADAGPAFTAFRNRALADQGTGRVLLTIPPGQYKIASTDPDPYVGYFRFKGINDLVVSAHGATLNFPDSPGGLMYGAGAAEYQFSTGYKFSSRLRSVDAGATSVTLIRPEEAANFAVGMWCRVDGVDMQGIWQNDHYGFPTNQHFFEFVKIASISGGTIALTAPLTNAYLETWPNFNHGPADTECDNGGPATLRQMQPGWAVTHEYQGLTENRQPSSQVQASGLDITFRDCTFNGGSPYGIYPTCNKIWRLINCVTSGQGMEIDKAVTEAILDHTTVKNNYINIQSSSVDQLTIQNGCDLVGICGAPKRIVANNSRIRWFRPGATTHGRTDSLTFTDCQMDQIGDDYYHSLGHMQERGKNQTGVNNEWTVNNGVIAIPNVDSGPSFNRLHWAIPGGYCWYGDTQHHGMGVLFKILAITQDATHCYIQTDQTWTGWPTMENGGTVYQVTPHACPKLTMTNCTGSVEALSFSQAPANAPIQSYQKVTYDSSIRSQYNVQQARWPTWPAYGNLVSVKINVTKAATVAGVVTANLGGFFHLIPPGPNYREKNDWSFIVDLKTAGLRTVTPTTVTGAAGADSIAAPGPLWLQGTNVTIMTDITAAPDEQWPVFTVEWICDQGFAF